MFELVVSRFKKALESWDNHEPNTIEFYEPLSEKTLKHKKILMISAVSIIVVKTLGIEVNTILGVKFTKITDISEIAGLIYWVLIYEFLIFSLSFWSDIRAWDFKRSVFRSKSVIDANRNLNYHLYKIIQTLNVYYQDFSKLRAAANSKREGLESILYNLDYIAKALDDASAGIKYDWESKVSLKEASDTFIEHISDIDNTKPFLRGKKFITYVLDFAIPVIISLFALYISLGDGVDVVSRVLLSAK